MTQVRNQVLTSMKADPAAEFVNQTAQGHDAWRAMHEKVLLPVGVLLFSPRAASFPRAPAPLFWASFFFFPRRAHPFFPPPPLPPPEKADFFQTAPPPRKKFFQCGGVGLGGEGLGGEEKGRIKEGSLFLETQGFFGWQVFCGHVQWDRL